jgi:hypothetical protein
MGFVRAIARDGFDGLGGARPRLDALGAARPPFFLLLAQKKEGKEKGTPTAWSPLRTDHPALLGQNRRCGTRDLRSLKQS